MTPASAPDEFLTAALVKHGRPLTGDQYVEHVLVARQTAWTEQHRSAHNERGLKVSKLWAPLLQDFVLDADIHDVELPPTKHKRRPQPRQYRPVSYWRGRVEKLGKEMETLSTPLINDRAAAGGAGLGLRRTRRIQAREDARLARYAKLQVRHVHAQQMLRTAQSREACQTHG